jgi:hypothetical protein
VPRPARLRGLGVALLRALAACVYLVAREPAAPEVRIEASDPGFPARGDLLDDGELLRRAAGAWRRDAERDDAPDAAAHAPGDAVSVFFAGTVAGTRTVAMTSGDDAAVYTLRPDGRERLAGRQPRPGAEKPVRLGDTARLMPAGTPALTVLSCPGPGGGTPDAVDVPLRNGVREQRPALLAALRTPQQGAQLADALVAAVDDSRQRRAVPTSVRLLATVTDPRVPALLAVDVTDAYGHVAAASWGGPDDPHPQVVGRSGRSLRGEPGPEPPALAAMLIRGPDLASTWLVVLGAAGVEQVEVLAGPRRITRPGPVVVLPGTDLSETGANGQDRIAAIDVLGFGADGSVIPAYAPAP